MCLHTLNDLNGRFRVFAEIRLFQSLLQLHWQEEGVASRTPIASLDKHTIDLLSLTLEMRSYCVSVLLLSTRYRPADNNRVDYTFAS